MAMIAIRQWSEPSVNHFANYLGSPRYLIPGSFVFLGILTEMFLLIAALPALPSILLNLGFGIACVLAHLEFAAHVYPKAFPKAQISHERAWRSIVAMARECQSAGLAIPNVPLGELSVEFNDWDLKIFEPLLRACLKTPPDSNLEIAPWNDFARGTPENYARAVPSLGQVRQRLKLNEKAQ
jgi:hypothetical protein